MIALPRLSSRPPLMQGSEIGPLLCWTPKRVPHKSVTAMPRMFNNLSLSVAAQDKENRGGAQGPPDMWAQGLQGPPFFFAQGPWAPQKIMGPPKKSGAQGPFSFGGSRGALPPRENLKLYFFYITQIFEFLMKCTFQMKFVGYPGFLCQT